MEDFKQVLSDWDKDIVFGLKAEDCPYFLHHFYDLLDDSYIQYYLLYLASKGQFQMEILTLSSSELRTIIAELYANRKKRKV